MPVTKEQLNEIATRYHNSTEIPDKFIEDMLQVYSFELMQQQLGNTPGRILELGTGDGIITEKLVGKKYNLTLVEGSGVLVEAAKKKFADKIKVLHCLFEEFNPTEFYDFVLANHVLEHVDDPVSLLKKIRTWLKPGVGKLMVIVPNAESYHRQLAVLMGLQDRLDVLGPRDRMVGHQRVYSFRTLEADLQRAGFAVSFTTGYFLKCIPNSMMLRFDPKLLQALLKISATVPKEMLANLFVVANPAIL